MKSIINKILFFIICFFNFNNIWSQNDSSLINIVQDTLTPNLNTSLPIDSTIISTRKEIKISKDAILNIINYGAVDSNFTDVVNKQIHLYGMANVSYETVKMKADYIIVDFDKNIVKAYSKRDSTYISKEKPVFENGETKANFDEIAYNFKTKKAYIKDVYTQESEFFILGKRSKYIAEDSTNLEARIFQEDAIITPCNHVPAHFGIRTRKMKMIPKKIAVMGPAQLEIEGIPTPLILPFGFFPLIKGRSSGIIFPSNYTTDPELGFGFQGIGYYFPINDYVDAIVRGDIWTRGTYKLEASSKYVKRYKYSGSVTMNFSDQISEDATGKPSSQKSFGIQLQHSQDSKAHPYRNIGGSVNISTNRNSQRTNFDYESRLNNKLYSNLNFTYRWPESPFSFRTSFSHNQDNSTRKMNVTFPDASLNMNTIQPFKRKNASGDPLWYENISLNYRAGLRATVETSDTTLFTQKTLDNIQTGLNHGASLSTNARALKYFSISPNISYEETYFIKTLEKELEVLFLNDSVKTINPEGIEVYKRTIDTVGKVNDILKNEFRALRKLNAGININTALFATKRFSKGWLRGLRHTMKPGISFNYSPETTSKYQRTINTSLDSIEYLRYNPFQTGAFPQSLNEEQMSLSYNISNVFEAKYRNKKDTVDKKFNIFNSIYMGGSYNFAADSFKWSDVSLSGNADLIKGYSTLQFNASWTPYEIDFKKNRRVNKLLFESSGNKKFLQLTSLSFGINSDISWRQLKESFSNKDNKKGNEPANKKKSKTPSFTTLFDNLRLNHNINFGTIKTATGNDSLIVGAHGIYISGSIQLSENWDFNIGSISYDLKAGKLVYPSFGFSRDLHCWTMRFNWYPDNGTYNMFIGVKSGALNFLKYDYRKDQIPRI